MSCTAGQPADDGGGYNARMSQQGSQQAMATAFDGKAFARGLTGSPGVYRYFDSSDNLLYVGKAGNLRKRVGSYFLRPVMQPRIAAMVAQVARAEVTVTRTESEALLLESQLIKTLKPRYNISLRDDKSYPYVFLSAHPEYPRLGLHRGAQREKGSYFGPFPGVHAVRESLNVMQKLFKVRQCEDSYFRNRSRPCLQYQIGRCSAPCVGLISAKDYQQDVEHARLFLQGRSDRVLEQLATSMEQASTDLNYERAAQARDRIATLRSLQAQHHVKGGSADMDLVSCAMASSLACISVLYFRNGISVGSSNHFPKLPLDAEPGEVLVQFLGQYYLDRPPPAEVVSEAMPGADVLADALSQRAGHAVAVKTRVRGDRARFLALARRNAEEALAARIAGRQSLADRFAALAALLQMPNPPERIECFDISHTRGEGTVASCVVFSGEGPEKSSYRRFNIDDITPGDDYAAMHQALTRRYRRVAEGALPAPDLLLIDGGKGQVAEAIKVLEELAVDGVRVVGVAKGPSRRAGEESLVLAESGMLLHPGPHSAALHLVNAVRDEAHRFAIGGHRRRRARARERSVLEEISGIGPGRRASLLRAFGGRAGLDAAGVEELTKVKGISRNLAQRIYDALHG